MANKNELISEAGSREILSRRTINAPRELVFDVWTKPEHIINWWGPNGFTNTIHEMEVKPGGTWRFMMHGPNGMNFPNKIVFTEVLRPERLVYVHTDDTEDGKRFHVVVTFEDDNGKTELTMHVEFPSVEERDLVIKEYGALEGNRQTMDKLEAYLAQINEASKELVIVREFNAPRELVFKAWTEAEHLAKWWGPKGMDLLVNKVDLQPGGIFHYRMTAPDGTSMWGRFIYKEIVSPEKLVFVSSFSDERGNIAPTSMLPVFPAEILNVVTFEERKGKTVLTLKGHPINASKEEMDVYYSMFENMNAGFAGTLDKLDTYLEALEQTA